MSSLFLSYRREDTEGQARALKSELVKLVGEESVYMDVDNIAFGRDFRHALQERLQTCEHMLVLIGRDWLDVKDDAGRRRLDNEADLVRQEIAAALRRNIAVTPVLVRGASFPTPEQLPDDIKDLAYRTGFELRHSTWDSDVRELVKRLGLDQQRGAPANRTPAARMLAALSAARLKVALVIVALAVTGIVAASYLVQRFTWDGVVEPGATPQAAITTPPGIQPEIPFGLRVFYGQDLGLHIIYVAPEQSALAETLGLTSSTGAVIWQVERGTGQAAGAMAGDVITAINEQPIGSLEDLRRAYYRMRRGNSRFQIRRDKQTLTLDIDCPTCEQ